MYASVMVNGQLIHTALVIRPPLICPIMPDWLSMMVTETLLGSGVKVYRFDAGLQHSRTHVLSCGNQPGSIIDPAMDLASDRFYLPDHFLSAKYRIDQLLADYSKRHFLYGIEQNGPPTAGWIHDPAPSKNKPFSALYHGALDRQIKTTQPDAIIFCVSSADQVVDTSSMMNFARSNYPDIELFIISGIKKTDSQLGAMGDHPPIPATAVPIVDFLYRLCGVRADIENMASGFKGHSPHQYPAPRRVLPVDASFFKETESLWQFMSRLHEVRGVERFAIENAGRFMMIPGLPVKRLFCSFKTLTHWEEAKPQGNDLLEFLVENGLTLVEWEIGGETRVPSLSTYLWEMSRKGIWNHVRILPDIDIAAKKEWFEFINSNPNIAHSYIVPDVEIPIERDPSYNTYSNVRPIPGAPFWRSLEHPMYLFLYLERYGKHGLFCMRSDESGKHHFKIGDRIRFLFKKPAEFTAGQMEEICKMVDAGGSVDITYVRYNLERAFLIGYAEENGVIVGNSSLKHPRDEFIRRITRITGLDFSRFVERGYTSVRPEYRALGVGTRLLAGLTKRAGNRKVFSIISEDNTATKKIALKNKTRKIAVYYSDKLGKHAGIWMPEHMIEDQWSDLL